MVSAGLAFVACLIAAFTLFALLGFRSGGWSALLLGAVGFIYAMLASPARISIVVFPLSVLWLLIGCVTIAFEHLKRRRMAVRRKTTAHHPAPPSS